MSKQDLALNSVQRLLYCKTQPTIMLNSNTWKYFIVCKQMIHNKLDKKYLMNRITNVK